MFILIAILNALMLLPRPDTSFLILHSCHYLITASSIHSASVSFPCRIEEGKLLYRNASEDLNSTSYGVVVSGEHWTSP